MTRSGVDGVSLGVAALTGQLADVVARGVVADVALLERRLFARRDVDLIVEDHHAVVGGDDDALRAGRSFDGEAAVGGGGRGRVADADGCSGDRVAVAVDDDAGDRARVRWTVVAVGAEVSAGEIDMRRALGVTAVARHARVRRGDPRIGDLAVRGQLVGLRHVDLEDMRGDVAGRRAGAHTGVGQRGLGHLRHVAVDARKPCTVDADRHAGAAVAHLVGVTVHTRRDDAGLVGLRVVLRRGVRVVAAVTADAVGVAGARDVVTAHGGQFQARLLRRLGRDHRAVGLDDVARVVEPQADHLVELLVVLHETALGRDAILRVARVAGAAGLRACRRDDVGHARRRGVRTAGAVALLAVDAGELERAVHAGQAVLVDAAVFIE